MTDLGFEPLDQEFLSEDAIRQETLQTLARLELDKHRLRLLLVAQGADAMTGNGTKATDEIAAIDTASDRIKAAYGHLLYPQAPSEESGSSQQS